MGVSKPIAYGVIAVLAAIALACLFAMVAHAPGGLALRP